MFARVARGHRFSIPTQWPGPRSAFAAVAALGMLAFACAPAGSRSARTGDSARWPEDLKSDYFAPLPADRHGSAAHGSAAHDAAAHDAAAHDSGARGGSAYELPDTSWSLAAAEWGTPDRGGFPTPERLTPSELRRLEEGWTVARPFEFHAGNHDYVGGVAFQIIEAPGEDVLAALLDVDQIPLALPLTHRAKLVSSSGASDLLVEVVQGSALMRAKYSVRLTRVGEHAIRFSMDQSRKHDIRDARGYFTATRFSERHTLVTVAVGIDLGQGLARSMLKRHVQKAALSAPAHLRRYAEPRAAAASGTAIALR